MRLGSAMLYSRLLSGISGLVHGFPGSAAAPQAGYLHLRQVHSNRVIRVRDAAAEDLAGLDADGLVAERGVVAVRTADCLPVLIADRRGRAFAAIHAGWRGLESGILVAAVEMLEGVGASRADLVAAIGPSIAACCYEVSADICGGFERGWGRLWANEDPPWSAKPRARPSSERSTAKARGQAIFIDLQRIAKLQLAFLGVAGERVEEVGSCTYCGPADYSSYRRATHEEAPRTYQWSFVGRANGA
jgi:purine-nucleoside/S-methyl-5'-thioadenosine phosphorylase / adenosine deaminase